MKVITHLINSIRAAANYNHEAQTKQHCILWTDKEKQWENVIPRFIAELPELLILGDYEPLVRRGPAIWLRVAIAGLVEEYRVPFGRIPVIYLPGVSRQDLRAVEQCPDELKPLDELQYRGVIWSQINARDWTIFAYLKSKKGGLGLNVNQDEATLQAMQRAINRILDEDVEDLKSRPLDKDFFNSLIAGVDTDKEILLWLSNPESFEAGKTNEEWQGFRELCKSKYKFDPEQDGVLAAAEKLGSYDEAWKRVWERFCEAPARYEGLPELLRKTIMPLYDKHDRFPQWNEQQEGILRKELLMLTGMTEHTAREKIRKLENEHAERRTSVWAQLGEAPLAIALKWISDIALMTSSVIVGDFAEIAKVQDTWGWQVDHAVISALTSVKKPEDIEAVTEAIRSVYLPWIDINARNLQQVVNEKGGPGNHKNPEYVQDECVCFIDGLRFDLAKRLAVMLRKNNLDVMEEVTWTPSPTVTATCKPALMSVAEKIVGDDSDYQDFMPVIKDSGQFATSARMSHLLEEQGWTILTDATLDKPESRGWYEFGRIDEEGHKIGSRIAALVEGYLDEVQEHILKIINTGWKTVKIVSDHGWLLMPGGLPKISMPTSLTESKWGRCAAIKPGALYEGTYFPWYWNENVHFALPDGVSCYRGGIEYSHGGISIQECLMLRLTIKKKEAEQKERNILVTDIVWRGMRCNIAAEGDLKGVKADIRLKPAVAGSSIVMGMKEFNESGIASVVVDNDSTEGDAAYIVLLDSKNKVIYQSATVVGGEG